MSKEHRIERVPVVNEVSQRKRSIIENTPAIFEIENDRPTSGIAPWFEDDSESQVKVWYGAIQSYARKYSIDPKLVMAVMYMETTHGYYDRYWPWQKTIRPMNVHYQYWQDLGVTKEKLGCPFLNVEFGTILLARIRDRVRHPTVEKVASLYNALEARHVTDYGARVGWIYMHRPWVKGSRTDEGAPHDK